MEPTYKKSTADEHKWTFRVRLAFEDGASTVIWIVLDHEWTRFTMGEVFEQAEEFHGIYEGYWTAVSVERYSYGDRVK